MSIKVGTRVEVVGKGSIGTVAYIGATLFSGGKWIGVILDESTGKNNGTVQGKKYFSCEDNHGIFVRQSQITALDEPLADVSQLAPVDGKSSVSSSQESLNTTPGRGGIPGPKVVPPRAVSEEDLAKKQQQRRVSGLRAPSTGKSSFLPSPIAQGTSPNQDGAAANKRQSSKRASYHGTENVSASTGSLQMTTSTPPPAAAATSGTTAATPKQTPASGLRAPGSASTPGLRPPGATPTSGLKQAGSAGSGVAAPRSGLQAPRMQTPKAAAGSGIAKPREPASAKASDPPKGLSQSFHEDDMDREISQEDAQEETKAADMTSSVTGSLTDKIASLEQAQEIENLKADNRDLQEKLETLKLKRAEDKAKLKEFEKAKIQMQQLNEYKAKMKEAQTDLQRQLQAAKKETRDIQDAFERYKDEMSDLAETVEIATLDKEMAEEKSESIQLELEAAREKIEEITLDAQIMKEEMSDMGTEGGASTYQVKQFEQQNERLKEALVKMRDLSNHEKQEVATQKKQIEKLSATNDALTKDKERLSGDVNGLNEQLLELQEHVDAAQGAEEMVEQLTEKTLEQEDQIQALEEEKADLEALCEMNDELMETTRETELELREELDLANGRALEAKRKLEAMHESIADYEATITKFRQLVTQLQESNQDLRSKQSTEQTGKAETPTIEMFDFKSKFAETKAHAKAIDMELRKLDVQQANQHVEYLRSFMPNSFVRRGGDHDSVLVLLLIPRLIAKLELLIAQVKEKWEAPDSLEREDVLKTHKSDAYSFAHKFGHSLCKLQACLKQYQSNVKAMLKTHKSDAYSFAHKFGHSLCKLQACLKQYQSALNTCNVELLLKIGTLLPELAVHEKTVDHFIQLLRKDQLDETVSLDSVDKSIGYFQTLYQVHLSGEKLDCTAYMHDMTRVILAGCDCLSMDTLRLKMALMPGQETSDISILLKDVEINANEIKVAARKIKRRIPQQDSSGKSCPLTFNDSIKSELNECMEAMSNVAKTLQVLSKSAMQQAAILTGAEQEDGDPEGQGLQAKKLEELAFSASDQVYGKDDSGPYECLRQACTQVNTTVKKVAVAMENGEYDFDGTKEKQIVPPVEVRSQTVKSEFADAENMKYKLEAREEDIVELKKQLKLKQEELSSQQVRVGLIERKLENATKDGDDKMDKIQQKLDEAQDALKKKEKEFEETMDALQSDIDALENEKGELKERLKVLSKKNLLGEMSRTASLGGGTLGGGGVSVTDSPMLLQQLQVLRDALSMLKQENTRLRAQRMKTQLADLAPLRVSKKPVGLATKDGSVKIGEILANDPAKEDMRKLTKNTNNLLNDLYKMSACPRVVDITKRKPGEDHVVEKASPMSQLLDNTANLANMQRKATELQVQVMNLMAANRTGGQIRSDFSSFPTPAFAKVLHEKSAESRCVGQISIPAKPGEGNTIPVHVGLQQLQLIHNRFTS